MYKKAILLTSIMVITGGVLYANAYNLNNYSPETGEFPYKGINLEISPSKYNKETKSQSFNYNSSSFKNYSETNTTFKLSGVQSIKNGYQISKTPTASTGVQYQIVTKSGTVLKYVTKTGVYNGNLSVDLSNANTVGTDRKLRLANYYNLNFDNPNAPVQSASGTFIY